MSQRALLTSSAYADLSINQKVELKGLLKDWASITQKKLQASARSAIYGKSVKRSHRRTNRLLTDWTIAEKGSTDSPGVAISSLWYGRLVEWGVGRGMKRGSAGANKRANRWYSPVKYRELAILRSLLIKRYNVALVSVFDQQLNVGVNINL